VHDVINYLVHRDHRYTINSFLREWGNDLTDVIRIINYDRLKWPHPIWPGAWIFSDLDRLDAAAARRAGQLCRRLIEGGPAYRVMNDPYRSLRRFDLLRLLRERGVNSFDVHRLVPGWRPERYPIFFRHEHDHDGAISPLLNTVDEFETALRGLDTSIGVIAVEFVDVARQGCYHKYSAFRIGDRIVPRHVFFSRLWMVKSPELTSPEQLKEEFDYICGNPHAERVLEVFELAGIQYGRIDYALHGDRIEVWEINTNPMIASAISKQHPARRDAHELASRAIMEAFRALVPTTKKRPLWRRYKFLP